MTDKPFQFRLITAILSICIIVNLFYCYTRTSVISTVYEVFFKGDRTSLRQLAGVDRLFAKIEKGNVLLRFEGFDTKGDSGQKLAPLLYFRSVFAYYPGKILIGDPELIVKKGNEFLDVPFNPEGDWFEKNRINYDVTFKYTEEGTVGLDVRELSKEFNPLEAHGLLPVFMRVMYFFLAGILVLLMVFLLKRIRRASRSDAEDPFRADPFSIFSMVTILAMFLIVCGHSLLLPLYEWDSFAIWGLKAKVLYYEGLASDYFQNPNLAYSHLDYPLLVPLLMSAGTFASGPAGEITSKIIFPFLYLGFILLVYEGARWRLNRTHALLLTAIFASTPALVRWSGAGTADMPLSLFYAGSIFYLIKFFYGKDISSFIISAVFSALCVYTKNEGLALLLINIMVLMAFCLASRKYFKHMFLYIVISCVICIPCFVFSSNIPKIHENYLGQLTITKIAENWDRLGMIIPEMLWQFFSFKSWGLFWILVAATAITGTQHLRSRPVLIIWLLFVGHLLLYMLIYMIYPYGNLEDLFAQTMERLYLHILPAGLLIIIFQNPVRELVGETKNAIEVSVLAPAYPDEEAPEVVIPANRPLTERKPRKTRSGKMEKPERAKPAKKTPKKPARKKKPREDS